MSNSKRRSAGEGSITRRKDGRWQAALQVDGRRRIVYGKTRSEAVSKLAELKRQYATSGTLPDPGQRTLSDLLDAWLEAKAPTWRPVTLESYAKVANHDIRPVLGTLRLARITPQTVHRLCAHLQAEDKARTALKVYRILSAVCDLGVRWGWLGHNPADRVDVPRYHAERKTLWTPEELQRFLTGTRDHPLHALWLTAVAGGMRLGELLALEWSDVDLSAGTLAVTKTRQLVDGRWRTTAPKTEAGIRTIALPAEAVQVLRTHRATQGRRRLAKGAKWRGGDRVFPVAPSPVGRALRGECKRLDLPPLSMHALRHLHASLLLGQGLPVTAVSARLGHAHAGITMSTYAHALAGQDDTAAQVIGRALAGGERR